MKWKLKTEQQPFPGRPR